ncbi:hypothetical protein CC78DRAFT_528958 [Lojkania enalia]|uniref:Class I glutamine amidotransferase-like protein n=1 Tax=Lojkania enalia TaxID=147567 RepID=A0A9P4NB37_9PLEO|nr:hypothetical protein CC78DRAFT_528958 [Didymosphaeria enalia]
MASRSIRIAMLNTDKPVPNILSQRGTFGSIFHNLLTAAAARVAPNVSIEAMEYDVRRGEYPICPAEIDIILITGSASSAYDSNLEWIHELDDYIFDTYTTYPHIKMFGACFGHQIICQSLLRAYGVVVEKDPNGWELGVKEIKLADEFRSKFAKTSTSASTARQDPASRIAAEYLDARGGYQAL